MEPARTPEQLLESLPQPSLPTGADRFAWERYRFARIARAMVVGVIGPVAAAEIVDGELADRYPFALGRRAKSKGEHPGGIAPSDRLTWLPMTRAETLEEPLYLDGEGQVPVPERARQIPERLAEVAEVYDPEWRMAKVILGRGGPSHVVGRYQQPVGFIRSVAFDGYLLWGLVEDNSHELMWAVRSGAFDRSTRLTPKSELDGSPWYLDHLALLWAESPVQPNLASLEHFWPAQDDLVSDAVALSRSQGWSASLNLTADTAEGDPPMSKETTPNIEDLQRAVTEQQGVMQKLKALFSGSDPAKEPATSGADPKLAAEMETMRSQVAELASSVKAFIDNQTAAETARAQAQQASIVGQVKAKLEGFVRAMKLTPQQAAGWRSKLITKDGEAEVPMPGALDILAQLDELPSANAFGRAIIPPDEDGAEPQIFELDQRSLVAPGMAPPSSDSVALFARAKAEAEKEAGGDPAKYAAAFHRIATKGHPGLRPN